MISEYLVALAMGVVLGIFSTVIGYLKQKNLPSFSWLPLVLRIPCGICAAILMKFYGITGIEALGLGLALTEFNESGIKLFTRRLTNTKLDLTKDELDKNLFHDLVVCTGDMEPGFDSYRGISAVQTVMAKYLDRLTPSDATVLGHIQAVHDIVKSHKDLGTEVEDSAQRRLNSLVRVWFQYLKDNNKHHRETYADLSKTLYEDFCDLCGLKPS